MKVLVKRYNVYLALFLLILFNGIFTNNFLRMNTCWNIVIQCTTIMLVSLGMTVVIASGGIDISIGPIMALAAIVFARMLEYSALYAVLAALAVSVICGLLNGVIIAKFQIQPMIVTLGMMNMVRGSAELMNDGRTYSFHHPVFSELGYYRIGGEIPIQLLIIVIAIVLMYLLMKKMRFGAYVEAMGDNRKAARLAGVKVSGMLILIYILSGFLAGVAGLVEAMRMSAADPINFGLQIEVDAIVATAIGGTNMAGGKANLAGTVAGVFVMQIITVMVNMNNIPYSYSLVIKTIVVILAVCVQNGRISTLLPAKRKGAVS